MFRHPESASQRVRKSPSWVTHYGKAGRGGSERYGTCVGATRTGYQVKPPGATCLNRSPSMQECSRGIGQHRHPSMFPSSLYPADVPCSPGPPLLTGVPAEQNFPTASRQVRGRLPQHQWSNFAALERVLTVMPPTAGGSQLRLKSLRGWIRARLIDEAVVFGTTTGADQRTCPAT